MSRVGKQPVVIPAGVKANLVGGRIEVEGPKGKLVVAVPSLVKAEVVSEEGKQQIRLTSDANSLQAKANWGTVRAHLKNSVVGVTQGWTKKLELQGVGFTAALNGNVITLATGYSHKTDVAIPKEVKATVGKQEIALESCNRELLGQVAATLRDVCRPEPYLGKGVRYSDETVRRKAGKTGAK